MKKSKNGAPEQCQSLRDRLPLLPGGTASDPLPEKRDLFHMHLVREVVAVKSLGEHIIRPEIQAEREIWE